MAITVNEVEKRCYSFNFKRNNVEEWVMNIVGCILFVIAGIIAIKVSRVTKKQGLSD